MTLYLFLTAVVIYSCDTGRERNTLVSTRTFNYPVLKGKKENPVLRVSVENKNPGSAVRSLAIDLTGTNTFNIKALRIFYTGTDSLFSDETRFGQSGKVRKETLIKGMQTLKPGINYFWVSCELADDAELTSLVKICLDHISLNDKKRSPVSTEGIAYLRTGVAVRKHGDEDVHTYRIPGLTTTNEGTLLAIYDVRRESARDLQGDIDIGLSRSTDGGNTWESMRIVLDMGEWGGLPFSNITYSKDGGKTWTTSHAVYHNTTESMAVQLSDGRIMLNMRDNRNRTEKGKKNGRAVATTSDLGETWNEHETSHVALIELDEGKGAGYSCLTSIDEKTIGILYEGSQAQMTFQVIDITEILSDIGNHVCESHTGTG